MEAQLADYRARKAKERNSLTESAKPSKISSLFSVKGDNKRDTVFNQPEPTISLKPVNYSEDEVIEPMDKGRTCSELQPTGPFGPYQWYVLKGLKVLLWGLLWTIFVEIGFGVVFVIASMFYFLYITMRSGPRDGKKLSAYSVFNPNFERIDGTFTAEQFERELRYGPLSL